MPPSRNDDTDMFLFEKNDKKGWGGEGRGKKTNNPFLFSGSPKCLEKSDLLKFSDHIKVQGILCRTNLRTA